MSLLRITAQRAPMFVRSFSASATRGDLVKDLYVQQLKAYKPAAKAADAHSGAVRTFSAPSAPTPPALPTDLAAELSKFDATEPVIGQAAPKAKAAASEDEGGSAEEYLAFLEKDLPKPEHH